MWLASETTEGVTIGTELKLEAGCVVSGSRGVYTSGGNCVLCEQVKIADVPSFVESKKKMIDEAFKKVGAFLDLGGVERVCTLKTAQQYDWPG